MDPDHGQDPSVRLAGLAEKITDTARRSRRSEAVWRVVNLAAVMIVAITAVMVGWVVMATSSARAEDAVAACLDQRKAALEVANTHSFTALGQPIAQLPTAIRNALAGNQPELEETLAVAERLAARFDRAAAIAEERAVDYEAAAQRAAEDPDRFLAECRER